MIEQTFVAASAGGATTIAREAIAAGGEILWTREPRTEDGRRYFVVAVRWRS